MEKRGIGGIKTEAQGSELSASLLCFRTQTTGGYVVSVYASAQILRYRSSKFGKAGLRMSAKRNTNNKLTEPDWMFFEFVLITILILW